jgi:hypothetical protein
MWPSGCGLNRHIHTAVERAECRFELVEPAHVIEPEQAIDGFAVPT